MQIEFLKAVGVARPSSARKSRPSPASRASKRSRPRSICKTGLAGAARRSAVDAGAAVAVQRVPGRGRGHAAPAHIRGAGCDRSMRFARGTTRSAVAAARQAATRRSKRASKPSPSGRRIRDCAARLACMRCAWRPARRCALRCSPRIRSRSARRPIPTPISAGLLWSTLLQSSAPSMR